jgi:hypothetical protein
MNPVLLRPRYAAIAVALITFVVYLTTMSHSVDFIDAGELATVCHTLGIAHPTGYPLFALVGYVFSILPIASQVIVRMNIMAALFTSLGAGAMVFLMFEILSFWLSSESTKQNRPQAKGKKNSQQRENERLPKVTTTDSEPQSALPFVASFVTGLIAAFATTWWGQSTSIEVYPLHLFLIPITLTFFLRMIRKEDAMSSKITRDAQLFAITLGLSFSNHLTTVLIAPACLYLYFVRFGFGIKAWEKIARLAIPFVLTLLLYLYLPIRSSQYPIMDWGHPANLQNFLKHVTGGQYKIWMFTGSASAAKNMSYFWSHLSTEFGVLTLLFALAGLVTLIVRFKFPLRGRIGAANFTLFTILLFFGCLFYAINYEIHDIDSYFLLAYLTISLWAGIGIVGANQYFSKEKARIILQGTLALGLLCAGVECALHYADADESGNYCVEDYAHNVLNNLPKNAIIFSTQWDFWLSGAFYYQLIEKERPDILVIDKAMLRDRPWYYHYLHTRAPEVMERCKMEEAKFLEQLNRFDRNEPFDATAIGATYTAFMEALVTRNLDRPIYATSEILEDPEDPFLPNFKKIPDGIQFRLLPTDSALSVTVPKLAWRDGHYQRRNYYTDNARLLQALPLGATAERLLKEGRNGEAGQFVELALKFLPKGTTEGLIGRDLDFARYTDERFARIAEMKTRLHP